MNETFQSVIPIFLIAFLGSLLKRKWLKSVDFWSELEKLSFYILLPAVLFENIIQIPKGVFNLFNLIISLLISISVITIGLIYFQYKFKYDKKQFTSVFQGCVRFNNYLFLALSEALIGDVGIGIASIVSPYMVIFVNAISVIMFNYYIRENQTTKFKQIYLVLSSFLKNPVILASLLGLVFLYYDIKINTGILKFLTHLSSAGLTLSILIIGASLQFNIINSYLKQIVLTSLVKLTIFPFITYFIMYLMHVDTKEQFIGILFSSMPCSPTASILSKQLKGDSETMSGIITFSTILSIFTISSYLYWLPQ
ncbi:MAG: AEC family transporter [Rickettsia sp.]|nr:AEC family transporter [Rickettsia sp.]